MGVGVGKRDVVVHIHNEEYDEITKSDDLGCYEFKAVPPGNYTLEATLIKHIAFPKIRKIAIDGDMNAEEITLVDETRIHDNNYVFGRILSSEGNPLSGVEIQSAAQGVVSIYMTSVSGYFELTVPRDGKVTITPIKKGYDFSFIPRDFECIPADVITRCDFKATNNGAKLFSVRGIAVDKKGVRIDDSIVLEGENEVAREIPDSDGEFVFYNLKPGSYRLSCSGLYTFDPKYIMVTIDSHDIDLHVIMGTYTYTTTYDLTGSIIDAGGNGIADVTLVLSGGYIVGDSGSSGDGSFHERVYVGGVPMPDSVTVKIKPQKAGFVFKPDSLCIKLFRIDDVKYADPVTLPDIIGTDYTVYTPSEHFPLSPTASWTYARSTNGGAPVEHVMAVSGSMLLDGAMYRTFETGGPAGVGAYRVDGAGLYGVVDGRRVEMFRFGVVPGTAWEVPRAMSLGAYRATFRGVEDVRVPAGSYSGCLKFELRTTDAASYETWMVWFAKGVGMVRQEHTLVNYGEVIERVADELKRYVR